MKQFIKQKRNTIGLLGIHVSFFTIDVFISTFLMAKLYTITDNNIGAVAFFNLVLLSCLFATFAIFSYIVKRFSRVIILRIAILIDIFLIVLIIILTDKLGEVYLLLGVINGISMGMYWAAMHTLAGEVIKKDEVSTYMIYSQIAFAAAKIIFPLTLGAIIDFISFTTSAWFTAGAGVIVILFTFFIKEEQRINTNLSMRKFFKVIKKENITKPVLYNYFIQFMYGAYANSISFSITILIVIVYKNNFSLGMYSSIFAAFSIFVLTLYRIIKNKKLKNMLYYSSALLIVLLSTSILFEITPTTLLLFIGAYLILSAIIRSESDALRLNIMKIFNHEDVVTESNLFIESAYWLARLFSLGLLIIISFINIDTLFPIFIFIMLLLMFTSGLSMKIWYKKYGNYKQTSLTDN